MYSRIETITPEIAKEYLKKNINNRPIKTAAIANYTRDMKTGNWQLTPQGISFYENGNLADGQNRLFAVIRANVPIDFYVTYDVPNESTIQDRCVTRSSSDILKMSGMSTAASGTAGVGTVNFLFTNAGRHSISDSVRKEFIVENDKNLSDAVNLTARGDGKNRLCKKASVIAGTFCALYCGINADDLVRFFEVANTGFSNKPEETAAIVLRNSLIQDYTGMTHSNRREAFNTTVNAIRDFSNGTPRTKKYRVDMEPAFWKFVRKKAIDKYLADYSER